MAIPGDETVPPEHRPPPRLDRVLTVPNVISLGRLLCVPVFLWLLFGRENRVAAAVLLAVLGATDWVDGYIARRYDQVSTVGKVLDPTADRLLLVVGIVAVLIDGSVPALLAWLAVVREAAVALLFLALAALGARRIDVTWAGKCATFLLMAAFPLFLLGEGKGAAAAIAWPLAVAGVGFSWYSAAAYVPPGLAALREGRRARTP